MATVGQQISQPETGWKRYDNQDSIFTYSSGWGITENEVFYSNSAHRHYGSGGKVNFNFTGTGLRIIGTYASSGTTTWSGNVTIKIDGVTHSYSHKNNIVETVQQALLFEIKDLNDSIHSVEINTNEADKYVNLDAVDIKVPIINKFLISSNEQNYSLKNGKIKTDNAIPKMTSNTTPSGEAFASSSTTSAYVIFDNTPASGLQITTASGGGYFIYGYKFPKKIMIGAYSILVNTNLTTAPKSWNFEGSNDGLNYINLGTVVNQTGWTSGDYRYFEIDNENEYQYYRVNITERNGTSTYIYELIMFEKENSELNITNNVNEENFIRYGMGKGTSIDLEVPMTNKNYILQDNSTLGSGKVFSKTINTTKTPIKKVSIK